MALIEDNTGNWRVGVLFSQTGVTSGIERTQQFLQMVDQQSPPS